MKSLFPDNFRWNYYFLTAVLVRLIFSDISWQCYFAIMITLYQFVLLFDSIGKILPTRHLFGTLMCLQFFIGPSLAYNGLDQYQYFMYRMKIPEDVYFNYALPAVILFIIGLHVNAGNNRGEVVDEKKIAEFVRKNKNLPYILIGIGLSSSLVSGFFSSDFAFVFYLIGGFKFIGLFLIVLGEKYLKVLPLVVVIGSIITSSLGSGMFHDLLTWFVYVASVFAIRYKLQFVPKLTGLIVFTVIAIMIQVLKSNYRSENARKGDESKIETLAKVYERENEQKGVFSFSNLAEASVRINQGFIITNIMSTVPDKEEYAHGSELYLLIEAAVMPRILAPNKLNAGDRTIFFKYSKIPITESTSMGLSTLGDAYINFGLLGGIIFMFIIGYFYSEVLSYFQKKAVVYPVLLLFTALVFYYPIRPDCETQTILGHLVKSCMLIFFIVQIWGGSLKVSNSKV